MIIDYPKLDGFRFFYSLDILKKKKFFYEKENFVINSIFSDSD